MARGLVGIVGEAACQVRQSGTACATKVIGHLSRGGAVVQLIGECERLGVILIEEALVVDASVEGGARHLHISAAVVAEVGHVVAIHHRSGGTCALDVHTVHLGGEVQYADRIDLITEGEASHGKWGLHVVPRGHDLRDTVVLNLLQFGGGVTWFVVGGHGVDAVGELTLLTAHEGTGTELLGSCLGTEGSVVAVHALGSLGILLVHHDVQYTSGSFGIVLGTWVGNHLDALNGGGGHALEYHRGVRREHDVRHTINIDLEI